MWRNSSATMRDVVEARAHGLARGGDEPAALALLDRFYASVGDSHHARTAEVRLWTLTHCR